MMIETLEIIVLICFCLFVGAFVAFWVVPRVFYICIKMGILAIHNTKKKIKEKEDHEQEN